MPFSNLCSKLDSRGPCDSGPETELTGFGSNWSCHRIRQVVKAHAQREFQVGSDLDLIGCIPAKLIERYRYICIDWEVLSHQIPHAGVGRRNASKREVVQRGFLSKRNHTSEIVVAHIVAAEVNSEPEAVFPASPTEVVHKPVLGHIPALRKGGTVIVQIEQ